MPVPVEPTQDRDFTTIFPPVELSEVGVSEILTVLNTGGSNSEPLFLTAPITSSAPEVQIRYLFDSEPQEFPHEVGPFPIPFFELVFTPAPGSAPRMVRSTITVQTNDPEEPFFTFDVLFRSFDEEDFPQITEITAVIKGNVIDVDVFGVGDPRVSYRLHRGTDPQNLFPTGGRQLGSLDPVRIGGGNVTLSTNARLFYRMVEDD